MSGNGETVTTPCPECGAPMPVHPEYVTWCGACNWNVRPQAPPPPANLLEKVYARLGERRSEALFNSLKKGGTIRPGWSIETLLALSLATVVHGVSLGLVGAGIWLIVRFWPYFMFVFFALICFGLAWLSFPRFGKWPDDVLSESDYPTLYGLADRVAAALGTEPVDGLVLTRSFRASMWRVTARGMRLVSVGLPLLAVLDEGERVALLAHEQAHQRNGDPARGLYVSAALCALSEWYGVIRPSFLWDPGSGISGFLQIPVKLIFYAVAGLPWLVGYLLVHLLWWDSQRAEYLADRLAAEVSGTAAMLSAMEKWMLEVPAHVALRQAQYGRGQEAESVLDRIRLRVEAVPPHEVERLRRADKLSLVRLDVTHPPNAYRRQMLDQRLVMAPKVALSQGENAQIDEELVRFLESAGAGWWQGKTAKLRKGTRRAAGRRRA